MTLRKAIFLSLGLTLAAVLVACGSSNNNTNTSPLVVITANAGGYTTPQAVGSPFGTFSVTVTSNGTPANGVTVTFASPSAADGTFQSNSSNSETRTTDSSGIATSSIFTAGTATGSFNVTATTSGASTSATFALTNTAAGTGPLAAGNYVYYVTGTDAGANGNTSSVYYVAGVFSVDVHGTITGGEQDFSDYNYFVSAEGITGGSVVPSATSGDTNLTITVNTGDVNIGPGATVAGGGSGTLVFDVSMASATKGEMIEYDTWASGAGELNFQPSVPTTACTTLPCGFAFAFGGADFNAAPISVGGVVVIDSAGGISGTGSVFDLNDSCASVNSSNQCVAGVFPANAFTASIVTGPDSLGMVVFSMNSSLITGTGTGVILDGYMIDANHIRLVENWSSDLLSATTGGEALGQTGTGGFSTSSVSGSAFIVSLEGADFNGALQVAGAVTFNSGGTLSGEISYNDVVVANAQGGTALTGGTYAADTGTGRVTLTGVTDGVASYNLQLYLTGDGHATLISMDAANANADVIGGLGWAQGSGLSAASLNGTYALAVDGFTSGFEVDGAGVAIANSGAITGFLDENATIDGGELVPDNPIPGNYSSTSTNGVLDFTGTGSSATPFTIYLVDTTQGVIIENDTQLNLGYFANQ